MNADGVLFVIIAYCGVELGLINFDTFVAIASDFFDEDEDEEMMQNELRQAFRLYDKEGIGFILYYATKCELQGWFY